MPGMTAKRIVVAGATGSIGESAAEVMREHPSSFRPVAFAALKSRERCEALAREFGAKAYLGEDSALRAVEESDADICLVATVGASGVAPALAAIEKGMDVALATKEVMVIAGDEFVAAARRRGVRMLPVDRAQRDLPVHTVRRRGLAPRPHGVGRPVSRRPGGPFVRHP